MTSKISDYGVIVLITATHITNESSDMDPDDFVGDDFVAFNRRNMVREEITSAPNYDPRIENVLKAMEMADLSIKQAARFFAALNMLDNQKKDR